MRYAHIENKTNKLLGWYSSDLDKEIPIPNIEVTEEQYIIAITNNHNRVNNDGSSEMFDFRTDKEIRTAEINTQIEEAKQYLAETGWYVERLYDPSSGKAIPEEVLTKRAEARELINTLEIEAL